MGRAEAGDQGKEGKHRDSDIHFDVDRIDAPYDDVGLIIMRDRIVTCTNAFDLVGCRQENVVILGQLR